MKRKTNLFYTTGPDSKFITFSNYTEALTGNYLSVNTKLFPDNFLCLNIKGLNSITKPIFIKYLVKYYENKLAVLRDYNVNNNKTIEFNIYPLAYLLEAILKVVVLDNDTYKLNVINGELVVNDNIDTSSDIENLITYIGQISECDYYGTYTDIICNIECENFNEGKIKFVSETDGYLEENTISINGEEVSSLYGWANDNIIDTYIEEAPIYDVNNNTYKYDTKISSLEYNHIDSNSTDYDKTLSFNVIIPLFSMVNINKELEVYSKEHNIDSDTNVQSIILNDGNKHCFDVPLGMWLYADKEEDTFIELIKDTNLNLYPNWSLLISSQFKPFPYSSIKKENATSNNSESGSIMNSFSTFSEVLSKMNDVLDNFNKLNNNLTSLNNRIALVEKQLKNIGTVENIQKIDEKVVQLESSVNTQLDEFKKQMYGYLNNLKWSSVG